MKIGNWEIPPRKPRAEDAPLDRAERPHAIKTGDLLESARMHDVAGFTAQLDAYCEGWRDYATDRNLFFSADMRALWKARAEAIQQAGAGDMEALGRTLDDIAGPLSQGVETAVETVEARVAGRAEATPAETKHDLAEAVEGVESIVQGQAQETPESRELEGSPSVNTDQEAPRTYEDGDVERGRSEMAAAEAAYLEEYKNHYRTKGAKESNEPEALAERKRAYDEARIAYGSALTGSARARLEERGMKPGIGERSKRDQASVLERYNRIVRYQEIIRPAAEKRYEAKMQALGERPTGLFRKGLEILGNVNTALEKRLGKNGAKIARASAVTLGVGLTAGFGTAGVLGALGWGTFRVGRSLASALVAASAGESAAQLYQRFWGNAKQEAAVSDLSYVGRHGNSVVTIDKLNEYDDQRMKLEKRADQRTLEREKMLVRALTALGIGAGTSAFLSHLPSAGLGSGELLQQAHPGAGGIEPAHPQVANAFPHPLATHGAAVPSPEAPPASPVPAPADHAVGGATHAPQGEHHVGTHPPHHANHSAHERSARSATAAAAPEASSPQQAAPTPGEEADGTQYDGPFKEVTKLPEGMNPESPEAAAYLNHAYNPDAFNGSAAEHAPAVHEAEATSPQPEAAAAPAAESAPPETTATPEPQQPEASHSPAPSATPEAPVAPHEPQAASSHGSDAAPSQQNPIEPPSHAGAIIPTHTAPAVHEAAPAASYDHSSGVDSSESIPDASGAETPTIVVTAESFTNSHGIVIDPKVPHLYALDGAKDQGSFYLYGGTPQEKDRLIQSFFTQPDNDGKSVWVTHAVTSDLTGQPVTLRVTAGGSGGVPLTDTKGNPMLPPKLDSFTRRIQ